MGGYFETCTMTILQQMICGGHNNTAAIGFMYAYSSASVEVSEQWLTCTSIKVFINGIWCPGYTATLCRMAVTTTTETGLMFPNIHT
jgi:hypothetical protein